jgi:CheY-like chemotaxis protein
MTNRKIVFFDDYPLHSENTLFVVQLRRSVGSAGLIVVQESTIPHLEMQLQSGDICCLILDIMSKVPRNFRSIETRGGGVPSSMAGVEILRRCRTGKYGESVKGIPIFMRTARGEKHIKNLCIQIGASGYFQIGTDDRTLVDKILEGVEHDE